MGRVLPFRLTSIILDAGVQSSRQTKAPAFLQQMATASVPAVSSWTQQPSVTHLRRRNALGVTRPLHPPRLAGAVKPFATNLMTVAFHQSGLRRAFPPHPDGQQLANLLLGRLALLGSRS